MLLLGTITLEQYVSAVKIPDYWNVSGDEERYQGTYTWAKADEPRYGNETSWMESSPAGYSEADIMDDAVIAAQEANYGLERVVDPNLVQLDTNTKIPDYFNEGGDELRY